MPRKQPVPANIQPSSPPPPAEDEEDELEEAADRLLYRITSGGFQADVDTVAYVKTADLTNLWFLSAVGTHQSCRTIASRILKSKPDNAVLQPNPMAKDAGYPWHFNTSRANDYTHGWTFSTKRLPESRAYNLVVIPLIAIHNRTEPQFILLSPDRDQPDPATMAALHYRYLDSRTSEPLHPSWAPWLWERAIIRREATLLEGIGRPVFKCDPDYDDLSLSVSRAIAAGELTVPR